MTIINFIYYTPPSILFFVIVFSTLSISLFCLYVVEQLIPWRTRHKESQNLGFIASIVGIIYAIITGFTISYVTNNFNHASDIVENEANTTIEIFRTANRMPEPMRSVVRKAMLDYAIVVTYKEWPLLVHDRSNGVGLEILNRLNDSFINYRTHGLTTFLTEQAMLNQLDDLYKIRNQRIYISHVSLIGEQWVLLGISTFLILFINCILGMELRLHLAGQIVVSLMVAAILFLILSIDRPFQGNFSVKPTAFIAVIADMNKRLQADSAHIASMKKT